MPRRVLIVSPHFAPVNAADAQRVRIMLPHLAEFGWEATVLCVEPQFVERAQDPLLEKTIPKNIGVVRVPAMPHSFTRRFGVGSLAWRAMKNLRAAGDRLLSEERYDCVFFSTTEFPVMRLGYEWKRRHGVPYFCDWQDPWVSDFYERSGITPPGGWLKYTANQWLARMHEPRVLKNSDGIISVSSAYAVELAVRYPDWDRTRCEVLPFGAPEKDFETAKTLALLVPNFGLPAATECWVYLGRGGEDMALAARGLFLAVKADRQRDPEAWKNRRLLFVGTRYALDGQKSFAPLAAACGIGDLVIEHPERIPYFEGIALLQNAARILLLGSTDSRYTASKALSCMLARRPLHALLHERSDAVSLLREIGGVAPITFNETTSAESIAAAIEQSLWFQKNLSPPMPTAAAIAAHTARAMTERILRMFSGEVRAGHAANPA